MLLLIDNYDSFTYNLYQYFEELGADVVTYRNDKIDLDEVKKLKNVEYLVISPGPGTPADSGISKEVINHFLGKIPILGVCLGHQTIGELFGCKIIRAPLPVHGKNSFIYHDGKGIYKNVKNPFSATRYHSLMIEKESVGDDLIITAKTEDGIIMGIKHKKYKIAGMQYHPEAILTEAGKQLLKNFLDHIWD